uniref:Uncharacterized protein n=1 Tax=Cucumis melo TaxID=3656 RepID=A0A9I9D9D5_CUCME
MSNRRKPLRRRTPSAKNPSAEERCQPTTPLSKNSKIHDPSAKELEELDLPKSFSSSSQSGKMLYLCIVVGIERILKIL